MVKVTEKRSKKSSSKRYILHSASQCGGRPACAFFLSEKGCMNGENCKFAHGKTSPSLAQDIVQQNAIRLCNAEVVSSESSEDDEFGSPHQPNNFDATGASSKTDAVLEKNCHPSSAHQFHSSGIASDSKQTSIETANSKRRKKSKDSYQGLTVIEGLTHDNSRSGMIMLGSTESKIDRKEGSISSLPKTPKSTITMSLATKNLPVAKFSTYSSLADMADEVTHKTINSYAWTDSHIQQSTNPHNLGEDVRSNTSNGTNQPAFTNAIINGKRKIEAQYSYPLNHSEALNNSKSCNRSESKSSTKTNVNRYCIPESRHIFQQSSSTRSENSPSLYETQSSTTTIYDGEKNDFVNRRMSHTENEISNGTYGTTAKNETSNGRQNVSKNHNTGICVSQLTPGNQITLHPDNRQSQNKSKSLPNTRESTSFRDLKLPTAKFSSLLDMKPDSPNLVSLPLVDMIVPKSNVMGRKWANAVHATQMHRRFKESFNIGVDPKMSSNHHGWIRFQRYGSWCANNPQVLAIDCEMCETTDPVSGDKDSSLCRFTVIDAETEEILIDSLVKPQWPVSDYRTRINGITAKHLECVEFTLHHAQLFLMALCSDETVLIGHGMENDLTSLKVLHSCVADSALLFTSADQKKQLVSLRELSLFLFDDKLPEVHDSVIDAKNALKTVKYYLENNGDVPPIPSLKNSYESIATQLLVHRICNKSCNELDLQKLFVSRTFIKPLKVESIEYTESGIGKTKIIFISIDHANLAFDSLEGETEVDKYGMKQKKVLLKCGSFVRVRKMTKTKSDGCNLENARNTS